jgi:hypothetical protein
MIGERVKGWSRDVEGGRARPCPVVRMTGKQWALASEGGKVSGMEREGMELVAALHLGEKAAMGEDGGIERMSTLLATTSPAGSPSFVPVYRLSRFFDGVVLPFTESPDVTPSSSTSDLIANARSPLDDLIALFDRRAARLNPDPLSPSTPDPLQFSVYAIYAPTSGRAEDVVPLLHALWRCRLWCGEGWEGAESQEGTEGQTGA